MSDDSTYETTSYEPTYDTSSYDTGSYDTSSTFDTTGYVETGSYSYDATDWSEVAAVSEGYTGEYYAESDVASSFWDLSTQAYLEGDDWAAYNLNQLSIEWGAQADTSWDAGNDVWSSMAETATTTTWEPATVDTGAYDTTVADTSWSATSTDTSWSASTDTADGGW